MAEDTPIPYWPVSPDIGYEVRGAAHSTGHASLVVQSTVGAKGNWYALSNSNLVRDASAFYVTLQQNAAPGWRALVDVGVSAVGGTIAIPAAAITPIVHNIHLSNRNVSPTALLFPIPVAAGQRLWVRAQTTSVQPIDAVVNLFGGAWGPGPRHGIVSTYGHSLGNAAGTQVDPGGTAGRPGLWSQLTPRTEFDIYWLLLSLGNRANTGMTDARYYLTIGVGPVGSEQPIITHVPLFAGTTSDAIVPSGLGPFPVFIPQGSRVVARMVSSITDATDRLLEVVMHGVS